MLFFRIIAWKICFIVLETLRPIILRMYPKKIWHFAFGANVSPVTLKTRKMLIFSSHDFLLDDFELCFDRPGPYKGLGFANVYEKQGAKVYGKLYQMYWFDCLRMDFYEGVPFLRRHQRVWKSQENHCFYFYQGSALNNKPKRDPSVRPTAMYIEKIRQGMENSHLDIPQATKQVVYAQATFDQKQQRVDFFWLEPKPHLPQRIEKIRKHYDRLLSNFSGWCYPHKPMGLNNKP
ncbi:MAG: gamma-glutamylcyclotransferase [Deltaproteobacteria bacterium]|nr:gamma-glutamylcyclotransferase [Deltaproteobacteria bacterium]